MLAYSERRGNYIMRSIFWAIAFTGLAFAQTPAVFQGGVLNGASFAKGQVVTPGSLVSIFGTSLASQIAEADTIPLSNTLGGVSVQFVNGNTTLNAPMLYVQPDNPSQNVTSQLNVQIPWELVPGGTSATVNVIVDNNGTKSAPVPVSMGPFSPGIFASGGRAIAVNNSTGILAWPAGAVPGLTTQPAKPGDVLIVYATGLGQLQTSPPADGQNSLEETRQTLVTPSVFVGGMSAQVLFSGLSPQFVGVNQLNIVVPNVPAGDALPIVLNMGGIISPSNITIAVTQ